MSVINRTFFETLEAHRPPRALVLLGARQVGKTTLLNLALKDKATLWFTGDKPRAVEELQSRYKDGTLDELVSGKNVLVIDEAQRIPNIGIILKILVDSNKDTKIYVTGSSALDLAGGVRESAVGRITTWTLWPISAVELAAMTSWSTVRQNLATHVVYGMYPAVLTSDNPRETLENYCADMLFKDIYAYAGVRYPQKLNHLLRVLAQSIGSEVNYDNLSRETGLAKPTLINYLDLLEHSFLIKRCDSYAKNTVNEIKKGKKIYFCDVGVRNALLEDFRPLSMREDAGALWENFFYMELIKKHASDNSYIKDYFWRERQIGHKVRAEVDFVEVKDTQVVQAFECKLTKDKETKSLKAFKERFPDCPVQVVTLENFYRFLQ